MCLGPRLGLGWGRCAVGPYKALQWGVFTDRSGGSASFVDHLSCLCLILLCFRVHLVVDALWSPAGKGLTSWLSFVMSGCDVVAFLLVSRVGCGA